MMYTGASMGRKKTTTSDTVDSDGFLVISGVRLWKWRALEAELRAAQAELTAASNQIQTEIAKNPDLSALLQQKAALAGTISTARSELIAVQAEIEKATGVLLKECAFDDKTGRLFNLAVDGTQGTPIKARNTTKSRSRKTS